jgi:hypothetical protein
MVGREPCRPWTAQGGVGGFQFPQRPINPLLTHSRMLSRKVSALLDYLVEEISPHELFILLEFNAFSS